MKYLLATFTAFCALTQAGTLYLPAYPNAVIVFDEAQGKIVDRIPLVTGTPMSMRASADRKKIYVTTVDHNGIEVIDVATRKVIDHFVLNTPTKQYRFTGGVADPQGKFFYAITKEIDKKLDRYEVGPPKYTVIDLAQKKIARTVDIAREDEAGNETGGLRSNLEISPDGKFLYQFRDSVVILDTSDFKVVDRIPLSKPDIPGMENISFGGELDSISEPGQHISLFDSADSFVHNRVFGIARFDLTTRQVKFDPIGPAPTGMAGLQVTPDKKTAYTVVTNGTQGKKRCAFWGFDLGTDRVTHEAEFPCRARFSFAESSDGKKLYIYGAGFEIDVYDAATFAHERTYDLNNDVTYGGIVVLP